jgi:hypothetical protein
MEGFLIIELTKKYGNQCALIVNGPPRILDPEILRCFFSWTKFRGVEMYRDGI